MKQDKAEKMIQKAERKAQKAAQQVQATAKKAEAQKQKQAAQAQKKAAKKANAATKQAAKKTKKAEDAAKKAQLAAKKAEEKKAKALAKVAAKAVESGKAPSGEEGEGAPAGKKKKSKKKLLMIAIPVLAVAIGAGVYFFVLRGGGEEEVDGPQEPIPIPLEYELAERTITALPAWGDEVLVYREEIPPEPPASTEPEDAAALSETEGGEEGEEPAAAPKPEPEEVEGFTKILYRYEGLQNPGALMTAYAAVMITEDAGFSTVDEELMRIDPPELGEMLDRGSLLLGRNVPAVEGGPEEGTQSLLLEWNSVKCSVTLDMPEGRVHDPKPPAAEAAAPRRSIEDLETMQPSLLGLLGESMDEYDLVIKDGSVRIANSPCTRVDAYDGNHQIAGSFFISSNGKLYRLEPDLNAVLELQWE